MMLHQLITVIQNKSPNAVAIIHKDQYWSYQELEFLVQQQSQALLALGMESQQRVAVFLPKQIETVSSFFAICKAGGIFVPVNQVLKANQVQHILIDCTVQVLITSKSRLNGLQATLVNCPDLKYIILVDHKISGTNFIEGKKTLSWSEFINHSAPQILPNLIDTSIAAILYTSGSTGKPKGVVLSHHNIVAGAESVSEYLNIQAKDKILAVLPFSFDYGLNQLIASILQGASCILLDYLFARDVVKALAKYHITGLAAVPSLWTQLAQIEWPKQANENLRFMTNSGGKLPKTMLDAILTKSPKSEFYLMYGLTEAFRSTYLPPDKIKSHPNSIGKAIPNAEIIVVKDDGSLCKPNEIGELVHKGSLVAQGYWNDPKKTAERFKPAPNQLNQLPFQEIAVWSGDQVKMDEEGYLYFIGRKDEMLKTSGYRVSPTEIEQVIYSSKMVKEAAAIGLPDDTLGQVIFAIISLKNDYEFDLSKLIQHCHSQLANYMVPAKIIVIPDLPKTPNGKIDKNKLITHYSSLTLS